MTAREVARLNAATWQGTLLPLTVNRHPDGSFWLYAPTELTDEAWSVTTDADALAQLVCDLGAHVGPVPAISVPAAARWDLPSPTLADRCVYAHPGRVEVVTPAECTPQEARRLALTLLVAAAVAEQQAGEVAS